MFTARSLRLHAEPVAFGLLITDKLYAPLFGKYILPSGPICKEALKILPVVLNGILLRDAIIAEAVILLISNWYKLAIAAGNKESCARVYSLELSGEKLTPEG